jgi:hypothetical protein
VWRLTTVVDTHAAGILRNVSGNYALFSPDDVEGGVAGAAKYTLHKDVQRE